MKAAVILLVLSSTVVAGDRFIEAAAEDRVLEERVLSVRIPVLVQLWTLELGRLVWTDNSVAYCH